MAANLIEAEGVPAELPLIPLDNAVMFPGGVLPLALGPDSTSAVERAPDHLVVIAATNLSVSGKERSVFDVGTVCRVVKNDGAGKVVVQGLCRCRIDRANTRPATRIARVRPLFDDDADFGDQRPVLEEIRGLGLQIIRRWPQAPPQAMELLRSIQLLSHLVDLVIANLELPLEDKQAVLTTDNLKERVKLARLFVKQVLDAQPARPFTGAACPLHHVPATGTCKECGVLTCEGCLGPIGGPELCPNCRYQATTMRRTTVPFAVASQVIAALVWFLPLAIASPKSVLLAGAGLGAACGLVAFADVIGKRLQPHPLLFLGLVLNALRALTLVR